MGHACLTRSNCTRPGRKPTWGRSHKNENWAKPHKGTTPPSTQNLKALGLRVFFLICCSTFSFLPNVGLRLTLEYLTISLSSVSLSSTLIHSPSSGSNSQPEYVTHDLYRRSHTYTGHGTRLPEITIRKARLSIQGQTVLAQAANQRLWYHLLRESEGETRGRSHKNENWAKPHKGMTPPSTQNLKALGLWVFFLICCSTFSFIPNVGLRLTLEYLTSVIYIYIYIYIIVYMFI